MPVLLCIIIIGVSLSEPHTSLVSWMMDFHILSVVHCFVNAISIQNIAHAEYKCGQNIERTRGQSE